MGTKTGNTAAAAAMLRPDDRYNPNNLLRYHTSLALVERLVEDGLLTREDYKKSCTILTKKYGFPPGSIFAETA